jgi:hypothetical protein
VIAQAHVAPTIGRLSKVMITRVVEGKFESKTYDVVRYSTKLEVKNNPEILPGDLVYVPESATTNVGPYSSALSVAALLWRALGK